MHNYETRKSKSSVAIVGARGYAGLELVRILLKHPEAEIRACFGTETFELADYLPEQTAASVPVLPISKLEAMSADLDTVFLATPAETSIELAPALLRRGIHVIDLSGAFRIKGKDLTERKGLYREWYGIEHSAAEWIDKADFGLCPWSGPSQNQETARLISNPGCYATAVLMGILPLLKAQLIDLDSLVIDAKSGASGAGRKPSEGTLFTEVEGECLPYKIGKHQHLPEIREAAATFGQTEIDPIFSTHLLNVRRGIIAGIYARLWDGVTLEQVETAFHEAYAGYPLVRMGRISDSKRKGTNPLLSLKKVVGSARTHLAYEVSGNKLFVYSSIDNLLKGAASQAIENFNRLRDLPVATALTELEGVL